MNVLGPLLALAVLPCDCTGQLKARHDRFDQQARALSHPILNLTNTMATDEDIEALSMLGGYLIFSVLHRRPLPKILTLIDAGAPLWYQDDEGTSPLHAAAYVEDDELVRILIGKGAIWNAGRVNQRRVFGILIIFSVLSSR